MKSITFLLVIASLISYFTPNEAFTCGVYDSQQTLCNQDSRCTYVVDPPDSYCACNSTIHQDVMIVMDISGSIGATNWDIERNWVVDLITTGITSKSRVGIVIFSSYAEEMYAFVNDQDRTVLTNFILGPTMDFRGGTTHTRDAIAVAISMFERDSINPNYGNPLIMVLSTDGRPNPSSNQNPTAAPSQKIILDLYNIFPLILAIGDFDYTQILGLLDDQSLQLILVPDFSSLSSFRVYIDTFTCPTNIQFTITEFRIEGWSATDGGLVEFVELFNSGDTLQVTSGATDVNFASGSTVTGTLVSDGSGGDFFWTAGSLLTLYNTAKNGLSGKYVNCYLCDCTDWYSTTGGSGGSTTFHAAACSANNCCVDNYYVPIGNNNAGSHASGLTFTTTGNYDNTNFRFETTLSGSTTVFLVQYNSANGWPTVFPGYSFTRDSATTDPNDGSNWFMSCWSYGTPGDGPLSTCGRTCTTYECQNQGIAPSDTGAVLDGDTCDCTDNVDDPSIGNGFYPVNCQCVPIDPPDNCIANVYITGSTYEIGAYWTASATAPDVTYTFDYSADGTPGTSSGFSDVYATVTGVIDFNTFSATVYAVHATYPRVWSTSITCTVNPLDPSESPTLRPTPTYPTHECVWTFINNKQVVIAWPDATAGQTISSYRLYYEYKGSDLNMDHDVSVGDNNCQTAEITAYVDPFSGYSNCQKTYISAITSPSTVKDDLVVYQFPVLYNSNGIVENTYMDNNKVVCTPYTLSPTTAPTGSPNGAPTGSPIITPTTGPPTPFPVGGYNVTWCRVLVVAHTTDEIRVDWTGTYPAIHSTLLGNGAFVNLQWKLGYASQTAEAIDTNDIDSPQYPTSFCTNCQTINTWYMFAEYNENLQSSTRVQSAPIDCEIQTVGPSPAPYATPTKGPSGSPIKAPTGTPTMTPSGEPTAAPTFQPVAVDNCIATIAENGVDFEIVFNQPTWDSPQTIDYTEAQYIINWECTGGYIEDFTGTALASIGTTTGDRDYNKKITGVNQFGTDCEVNITVHWRTQYGGAAAGPTYTGCTVETMSPTVSGYKSPTSAPSFSIPKVYFDTRPKYWQKFCTFPDFSLNLIRTRDRLPVCALEEKGERTDTYFQVLRESAAFPNKLQVEWQILCCDPDDVSCVWGPTGCDANTARRLSPQTTYDCNGTHYTNSDDFRETEGNFEVDGGQPGEAQFGINIKQNPEQDPCTPETLYIALTDCYDETGEYGCLVPTPGDQDYPTMLGGLAYGNGEGRFTNKTTGSYPTWIWWPIAIGLILLPILGWFGYRYYQKRKLNEEILDQRKHELGQVENMDGIDNFGGVGDDVHFNPLATAGTSDIPTTTQFADRQLNPQKNQFDKAQVDTDQEVFKQNFGPTMAQKHHFTDFN